MLRNLLLQLVNKRRAGQNKNVNQLRQDKDSSRRLGMMAALKRRLLHLRTDIQLVT